MRKQLNNVHPITVDTVLYDDEVNEREMQNNPGLWKSWLADVDGCMSCGGDHRGVMVTPDRRPNTGDWFVCPNTSAQVRCQDIGNKSVSIAAASRGATDDVILARHSVDGGKTFHEIPSMVPSQEVPDGQPDGLSPEGRIRTRQLHVMDGEPVLRSDREALGVSGGDDARPTDGQEEDDDDTELTPNDIREALGSFSVDARRVMFDALRLEFETDQPMPADEDEARSARHAKALHHMGVSAPDAEAPAENTYQVGGKHYGLRAFQHWDIVVMFNLDYFQGQITKYVMRWRDKNGVEDLEKAAHYLEKYITSEKEKVKKMFVADWKTEPATADTNPFGVEAEPSVFARAAEEFRKVGDERPSTLDEEDPGEEGENARRRLDTVQP